MCGHEKYLRTKIRKLKTSLENSGLDYNQIFKSICNLSISRDTLDFHFKKIFQDLTYSKKNQITINQVKFYKLNQEMRMRVLGKCIKDISKSYYSQRSKKIINLDKSLGMKNNSQLSLGGCLIFKDKNQILIKKAKKIKNMGKSVLN